MPHPNLVIGPTAINCDLVQTDCPATHAGNGSVAWRSTTGKMLVAHLECYPEEQLLRVRELGGGTVQLVPLKPRELALTRISTEGLRVVAVAKLNAAGYLTETRHSFTTRSIQP